MSGNLRDAESPKAFSDAKPAISLQKPILLAVISVSAGYLFGSVSLSAVLLLGLVIECFSDVIVGNILMPPFADNRPPSEGLTEKEGKVCPYWPKYSIRGPKFMGLQYEDVEFPSAGGATVRGWLISPDKAKAKKNALLICMHGAGRDRRAWLRHTPFLLEQGYTCLAFDFRAHGCSDGVGEGGTTLGIYEMEDAIAAVRWARKCRAGMKIGLIGTSTGGVASILAASYDDMVRSSVACIVAENAFSSPESVARQTVSEVVFKVLVCKGSSTAFALVYPIMLMVKALSVIKIRRALFRRCGRIARGVEAIKKAAMPMLLMHGTDDKIVSFRDTEEMYGEAGVEAGALGQAIRKELWLCEGAEHCQLWDTERAGFESRVVAFLDKFLA